MKLFEILIIMVFMIMFDYLFARHLEQKIEKLEESKEFNYDYIINLKTNPDSCYQFIELKDERGTFIIHPDSLEEFIQKDNI
jgi:hypothetical protein